MHKRIRVGSKCRHLKGDELYFKMTYENDCRMVEKDGLYLISDSCNPALEKCVMMENWSSRISLYLLTVGFACLCLTLVSPLVEKVGARTLDSRAGRRRPGWQPRHLYKVTETDEKTGETRYGFIDKTGKLIIGFERLPKETAGVGKFQEGRAVIYVRKNESDGKTPPNLAGYIDETGKIVIAPRFDSARGFSEGLAYVETKGFRGYINRRGIPVITLKVGDLLDLRIGDVGVEDLAARDFHEGLAAVGSDRRRGGKWGYIDHAGRLVVKPQYLFADDFSEGLAGVEIDGNVVRFGFIDKAGKLVIQPRFRTRKGTESYVTIATSRFKEGLACVREGELYGYINKRGEFVIPPQFDDAQEFSEGLAWVVGSDRKKVGWIDKSGRWVVTGVGGRGFQEEVITIYMERLIDWRYSEGLTQFIIKSEGRYMRGYMDRRGRVVIKPRGEDEFGILTPFVGGVAMVFFYEKTEAGTASKYGYIDKSGRFIWRSK